MLDLNALKQQIDAAPKSPEPTVAEKNLQQKKKSEKIQPGYKN